jgi:sulfate transport system permease protein
VTLSIAGASFKRPSVLPGFAPAIGVTLVYLTLIVLLPLAALILKASGLGFGGLWAVATQPRVLAALKTTFGISLAAALIDVLFGAIVAWTLTRYRFPGRRLVDALVDLPFALPTAVAGIALASLYAPNGWLGAPLAAIGVKIAFTRWGILVALTFVGLPFVVRTVQPLIEELEREVEEVSATLGATRWRTVRRVLLPPLVPALLTGLALAFARGVGEYGSVIFIAGNIAYVSEIAPLLIVVKLEEYDYAGATAIAAIMLVISFVMLLTINLIQAWSRRRVSHV